MNRNAMKGSVKIGNEDRSKNLASSPITLEQRPQRTVFKMKQIKNHQSLNEKNFIIPLERSLRRGKFNIRKYPNEMIFTKNSMKIETKKQKQTNQTYRVRTKDEFRPNVSESSSAKECVQITSTKSGGITYSPDLCSLNERKSHIEGDTEVHVLKSILLRENHLQILQDKEQRVKDARDIDINFSNLLDIIRILTVEVVEAIFNWRRTISCKSPFLWNGTNYLTKIPSDLDFLSRNLCVTTWLGFSMMRNPFIIPLSMEQYPERNNLLVQPSGKFNDSFDVSTCSILTSSSWIVFKWFKPNGKWLHGLYGYADDIFDRKNSSGYTKIGGVILAKGEKNLLNSKHRRRKLRHHNKLMCKKVVKKKVNSIISQHGTVPTLSFVEDLDMLRIREAEFNIMMEENVYGRSLRSNKGHMVPAWKQERDKFEQDLKIDDGAPITKPAGTREGLAPFAIEAGSGHNPIRSNYHYDDNNDSSINKKRRTIHDSYKKIGGELFSFQCPGKSKGRICFPLQGNRSHFTDIDLTLKVEQIKKLQNTIDKLKKNLSYLKEESIKMTSSSCQESEVSKAKEKSENECYCDYTAQRIRQSREVIEKEIKDHECGLEIKKKQKIEKDKQLRELKRIERSSQDRRRAIVLERKRRMISNYEISSDDEIAAQSLEDMSIIAVQKRVRGILARVGCRKRRAQFEAAATTIEGLARGLFDRKKVKKVRRYHSSAKKIQKYVRGKIARLKYGNEFDHQLKQNSALIIQKYTRRMLANIFVRGKILYSEYARDAAFAVSSRELCPNDFLDLADVIHESFIDEEASLPPNSVLGLIKIVSLMLDVTNSSYKIIKYSSIGSRSSEKLTCDMTWDRAKLFLRRTSIILRAMQDLAMGPTFKITRKLHLSYQSINLYHAYENEKEFSLNSFAQIGKGSRVVCQMFKWAKALMDVFHIQDRYLGKYSNSEWINNFRALYKEKRNTTISFEVKNQFLKFLKDNIRVMSNSQKIYFEHEEKVIRKLKMQITKIDKNIEIQKKRNQNEFKKRLHKIISRIVRYKTDIKLLQENLMNAQNDFNLDIYNSERHIEDIQIRLSQKQLHLRRMQKFLDLNSKSAKANDQQLQSSVIGLDDDLIQLCAKLGKAQGYVYKMGQAKNHKLKQIGSVDMVTDIKYLTDTELLSIIQDLKDAKQKEVEQYKILQSSKDGFEQKLRNEFDAEDIELSKLNESTTPLDEISLCDVIENEVMAQEERLREKTFVPKNLLLPCYDSAIKLICVSRDLPALSYSKIINQLLVDLDGNVVKVNFKESFGIDLNAFQSIIDAGQNIIATVDVGIGENTRSLFNHCLSIAIQGLDPSPSCICILGSTMNRKGNPNESYLGVDKKEFLIMRDGKMKEILENINHIKRTLKSVCMAEHMTQFGSQSTPSLSCILILEAIIILISPQSEFFYPSKTVSSITWQIAKDLLIEASMLQNRIYKINTFGVPNSNLQVLQMYIAHQDWPKKHLLKNESRLLLLLCELVENVVAFGVMLFDAGGEPKCLPKNNFQGTFDAVFTIKDSDDTINKEDTNPHLSWMVQYNHLMMFICKDRIAHHESVMLEGENFDVTISTFRDKIFFFAQKHLENNVLVTSVETKDVHSLLAPNSVERQQNGLQKPPRSKTELYSRLTDLLSISKKHDSNSMLICKRKLTRLLKETRYISGHLVTLKVSEGSRGELLCEVYVPRFSTTLEYDVTEEELIKVIPNGDPFWEIKQLNSSNALTMLRPVTDRLKIFPRLRTIVDMGYRIVKTQTLHKKHKTNINCQNLYIRMRTSGGVGRCLFSCVHKMMKVPYVITVKEIGRNGILLVQAYNLIGSVEYETRICETCRTLCLGGTNSDCKRWKIFLLQRLSIKLGIRDKEKYDSKTQQMIRKYLHFDTTLFRTAKKIGKSLFRIQVQLSKIATKDQKYEKRSKISLRCTDPKSVKEHIIDFPYSILSTLIHTTHYASNEVLPLFRDATISKILSNLQYNEDEDLIYFSINNVAPKNIESYFSKMTYRKESYKNKKIVTEKESNTLLFAHSIRLHENNVNYSRLHYDTVVKGMQKNPIYSLPFFKDKRYDEKKNTNEIKINIHALDDVEKNNLQRTHDFEEESSDVKQKVLDKNSDSNKFEEVLIFHDSLKVRRSPLPSKEILMIVKVYESYKKATGEMEKKDKRILRFELNQPNSKIIGYTSICGESELQAIMGPAYVANTNGHNQSGKDKKFTFKTDDSKAKEYMDKIIRFIVKNQLVVVPKVNDKKPNEHGSVRCVGQIPVDEEFSIVLTKRRTNKFTNEIQTWSGITQRDDMNHWQGVKVMRKATRIAGVLLYISAFEIRENDCAYNCADLPNESISQAPIIRFVAYHNETSTKMELLVPKDIVKEKICGTAQKNHGISDKCPKYIRYCMNTATARERYEMAALLCMHLKIKFVRGKPLQLFMPRNQMVGIEELETNNGKSIEVPCKVSTLKRNVFSETKDNNNDMKKTPLLRACFNIPLDRDPRTRYHCVVEVYRKSSTIRENNSHDQEQSAILVKAYIPNLSENCELVIRKNEQEIALGGHERSVFSYGIQGEAIEIALRKIIQSLVLSLDSQNDDSNIDHDEHKPNTGIRLLFSDFTNLPSWRSAYLCLDTKCASNEKNIYEDDKNISRLVENK